MTIKEIRNQIDKCSKYLRDNNLEIIVQQEDRTIYNLDGERTLWASPLYGDPAKNIEVCTKLMHLIYLLAEMEDLEEN